jgi:membrane protein DedA with SNARE-associated domain
MHLEDFLGQWGYAGIFFGLIATGLGFPMPEELPVVMGGALAGSHEEVHWWIMLPVSIVGVIIGDGCLYVIGRLWGPRLLENSWIKRRVFPPDRLAKIEQNFHQYGVKLLLFARLTPGIRTPVFFTAGLTKLPLTKFLIADGLYAIPGVSLLFFLGYWFGGSMVDFVKGPFEQAKSVIVIVVIVVVVGYVVYRVFRKPVVTGDPKEMPPIMEQMTHKLEQVTSKIIHPKGGHHVDGSLVQPNTGQGVDGQLQSGHSAVEAKEPKTPGTHS